MFEIWEKSDRVSDRICAFGLERKSPGADVADVVPIPISSISQGERAYSVLPSVSPANRQPLPQCECHAAIPGENN